MVVTALVAVALVWTPGAVPHATADGLLGDGAFETTGPSAPWTSTDSLFGSALCLQSDGQSGTQSECGSQDGAAGPRSGAGWARFGGAAERNAGHTATVSQRVLIPAGNPTLTYYFRNGTVGPPYDATLKVTIDGAEVKSHVEATRADTAYLQQSVSLRDFADGRRHELAFVYTKPTEGRNTMTVDDVSIELADGSSLETRLTTSPSGGRARSLSVPFGFASADAAATFQCAVDAAAYTTCTSPTTMTVAPGQHVFRVRAADSQGLVDATPAEVTFTAYDCPTLGAAATSAQQAADRATSGFTAAKKAVRKARTALRKAQQTRQSATTIKVRQATVKRATRKLMTAKATRAQATAQLATARSAAAPCTEAGAAA